MKKITAAALSIILCFMISGCIGNKEAECIGKCTILVECSTIFDNINKLDKSIKEFVPESGIILDKKEVDILDGDSVYDVLNRELKKENILMEASFTGKSAYVEGIDNIYEFSCGKQSGWMYCVNGEYPGTSCSSYKLKDGDVVEWHYTCDLGEDLKN